MARHPNLRRKRRGESAHADTGAEQIDGATHRDDSRVVVTRNSCRARDAANAADRRVCKNAADCVDGGTNVDAMQVHMRRALVSMLIAGPITALGAQLPDTSACPSAPAAATARDSTTARRDSIMTASETAQASAQGPAIVLRAAVSAREVRFASQPRIQVRLCGAVTDSVHVLERRNLPDPVQAGATYRDVYIAVEILGHLNADCIAQRIGVAPDTARTREACASLGVRDTLQLLPRQRRIP